MVVLTLLFASVWLFLLGWLCVELTYSMCPSILFAFPVSNNSNNPTSSLLWTPILIFKKYRIIKKSYCEEFNNKSGSLQCSVYIFTLCDRQVTGYLPSSCVVPRYKHAILSWVSLRSLWGFLTETVWYHWEISSIC